MVNDTFFCIFKALYCTICTSDFPFIGSWLAYYVHGLSMYDLLAFEPFALLHRYTSRVSGEGGR